MENNHIKFNSKVTKLCNIEAKPIIRNKTWFPALDEIYGRSDMPAGDEFEFNNIGMPKGKISLWAGESGVGKSRLCIEVAKNFSTHYTNGKVLYIQTESPLEDFAAWAKDTSQYDRIYCSGVETQKDIIDVIYQVRPKLIFIDSVNEIEDFIGNAKSSSRLIKGDDTVNGLKQAVYDVGAHLILLGQLNGDGKTIKGGTSLPHLVDVALNISWLDKPKGYFKVEVGVKHRYGNREHVAYFQHTNDGVIVYNRSNSGNMGNVAPNNVNMGNVDSLDMASAYVGEQEVNEPTYLNGNLWTVRKQNHYLKTKAERIKDGSIKVDGNGMIIPKESENGVYMKIGNFIGSILGK